MSVLPSSYRKRPATVPPELEGAMLGLVALVVSALMLAAPAQSGGADEAAVREVVRRYVDAREVSDPAAIRRLFTQDADQLTSSGEWRRGGEALVRGMLASSKQTAGTRSIAIGSVRAVAPDVAIADGEYTITPRDGTAPRRMWTSFVLVRGDGGWQIAAIRNMLPAGQ